MNLHYTLYGINYAGNLGEHAITRRAGNSASMLLNEGVRDLVVGGQRVQSGYFIRFTPPTAVWAGFSSLLIAGDYPAASVLLSTDA